MMRFEIKALEWRSGMNGDYQVPVVLTLIVNDRTNLVEYDWHQDDFGEEKEAA